MNVARYILIATALFVTGCQFPVGPRSVVRVTSKAPIGTYGGTGFIVDKHGDWYIAFTAAHVSQGPNCKVNGEPIKLKIANRYRDLSVLFFRSKRQYKPMTFSNPSRGKRARLVGYPVVSGGRLAQSEGHVMGVYVNVMKDELWYDGGAVPGFSGGPVVDDWGRVMGMAKSHYAGKARLILPQYLCYDTALQCVTASTLRNMLFYARTVRKLLESGLKNAS